ncbi:reticulon-1 isoform X2 [Tachyglossus aculeatus]|uniref:reticulon-1 isoform X2 n=1 Tax=Tachyglossus aculeatus TaxID=9261 RepID=UPI0018F70DFA|nr:reticulon-1 isoform X2 [Tachyglossus aculeatus]
MATPPARPGKDQPGEQDHPAPTRGPRPAPAQDQEEEEEEEEEEERRKSGSRERPGAQRAQDRPEEDHPPVTMATASPGEADARGVPACPPGAPLDGREGAFYTSLIANVHAPSQQGSFVPGLELAESGHGPFPANLEGLREPTRQGPAEPEAPGPFSSASGIKMTPAESAEVSKAWAHPLEQTKAEAGKYIDIRRPDEPQPQESWAPDPGPVPVGSEDRGPGAPAKSGGASAEVRGHLFEESAFAPYIDDGVKGQEVGASEVTAPITITLTEVGSTWLPAAQEETPEEEDKGLKPGNETVPKVTVSEPEDDSPGSVTPPSSGTDPSGSESQGKCSFSEDELVSAIKEARGFSFEIPEGPDRPESRARSVLPPVPATPEPEASSAESGDSEIELVSEDPLASEEAPLHSSYVTFSSTGGPPPSPASPSIQYSILREEREAELDSELIIESCDASSASEESPKREQDSPPMRPVAMDIIQEENGPRTEPGGEPAGEPGLSAQELRMNRQNLTESASLPQGASEGARAHPAQEWPAKVAQEPRADPTPAGQSKLSSQAPGLRSPLASVPELPFLSRQTAIDLLYWRDIKQTGIVFGSFLLLLFSLTQFSVVSVVAYLALAALSATISFRIYKSVLQAVQKTDEGHPFKAYLELEISLSQDQIQKYTDCLQLYVNSTVKELRRLFLVQDLVDSLKFAVLMWLLTYVGALFNGLTLLIMAVVSMFTLPVVYVKHQAQVDQYLGLVRTHINAVVGKIQAKIPGAKRQAE